MAPAAAFSEVLDQVMGRVGPSEPPVAAGRWRPGVATPSLYWMTADSRPAPPVRMDGRSCLSPATATPTAAPPRVPAPAARPVRPVRTLNGVQRHSLRVLVRLGADLDTTFTDTELRRAFRTLAHRYHPDRHPGAGDAERAGLASRFAELRAAYDELKRAA